MEQYKNMAEENPTELKWKEEEANRRLLSLETVIGYMASVSFLVMIFTASFVEMRTWTQVLLICIGAVIFAVGMYHCIKLEHDAGYYECQNCKERYIPKMRAVVFAPHIGRRRKMKCPYCGKRNYHRKTLSK